MKIIPNTINIKVIFPNQDSFPSFIVTFFCIYYIWHTFTWCKNKTK